MADEIPAGAYSDCAKWEQEISTTVLGGKKSAFDSRSKSLAAMRTAVNEHEGRLDTIESKMEEMLRRPF